MRRIVTVTVGLFAACGDDLSPTGSLPDRAITLMSYNLAQIEDGARAGAIADQISSTRPDFLAVEECVECDGWLGPAIAGDIRVTEPRAGVAIAYDSSRWLISASGVLSLGDNDDGWGERVAQWGRFSTRDGRESIYFYATHWCVTIRTPDDPCTVDRQLDYADVILDHIESRSPAALPAVLAGDFNVFDGFEQGEVISYLKERGLTDLFRVVSPDEDGTTFLGNSWAPSGRVDYLFSTAPVDVIDARIDPVADASDHYPVVATVLYRE